MSLDLSSLLPFESASRWGDTLTALARTDPGMLARALGVHEVAQEGRTWSVHREVPWDRANLPDIVLRDQDGAVRVVVSAVVLGDFTVTRLARYQQTRPGADDYVVLTPRVFGERVPPEGWRWRAWEDALAVFAGSSDLWSRETALWWLDEIQHALPSVDGATAWDDVSGRRVGRGIGASVRARLLWLDEQVPRVSGVERTLHGSSGDNGWILELRAATGQQGYSVVVECEEQLSPRYFTDPDAVPRGLTAFVALELSGVRSSRDFDWDYLLALWHVMSDSGQAWTGNPARPKAPHDLAGQRSILERGAPAFLGAGYGEKNAQDHGCCLFGARIRFAGDATMAHLRDQVERLSVLAAQLAQVQRP